MRFKGAALSAAFVCSLLLLPLVTTADTSAQQAALQAQLDQINNQIAQSQSQLTTLQGQRASYERDVSILNAQIKKAQLQIQARNLSIQQIQNKIAQTKTGISGLDQSVAAGQDSLAQIIRETRAYDDTPMVNYLLSGSLEDLFREMDDFQAIQKALGESFTQMAAQRSDLVSRQTALEQEQQDQSDLLTAQQAQQDSLKGLEKQKQKLVDAAKGQESIYQQLIATQQKTAAQIKEQLFALRDAKSVSFGDMYQYAKEASVKTGVEPAFILGILREESDLGQNVGSCTYETAMSPANRPTFLELMQELGRDPDSVKVSCKPWYGWGGAMGPAQFIPSTWSLYEDRIANATGQNPPDPYDPRTAVFASAILLMDNGADTQTEAAERLAALRYFAGWKNATKAAYSFYGDDVMGFTDQYRQDIQVLE